MIMNGLMNAECSKPLKELKKGEYFRWECSISPDRKRDSKSIFKKGSYDRSQKKYECREYLWKKEGYGDRPSMYNTIPVDDNEWLGMTRQKRIYLEGSTLVRKNPQ